MSQKIPEFQSIAMSEEKYPIMLYTKHSITPYTKPKVIDENANRRNVILQIIDRFHKDGRSWDSVSLRKELESKGYQVDKKTIRDDITKINMDNNFVLDLAMYNYNGMIEYMFDIVESTIRQSDEVIETEWTQSKTITNIVETVEGTFESKQEIITKPIAGPKNQAIQNKIRAMNLYTEIFKGGIIDVSIALLDKQINRIVLENEELKELQAEHLSLNESKKDNHEDE